MSVILPGDKELDPEPSLTKKSLRINLNENIYGTFAEIGAGQEVGGEVLRAAGQGVCGEGGQEPRRQPLGISLPPISERGSSAS